MWRAPVQDAAPGAPAVSVETCKTALRIDGADADALVARALAAAIAAVEATTSTRLAPQTLTVSCTEWCDLAALPIAPVTEVTGITYFDALDAEQTLAPEIYEARLEGLAPQVVLAFGQWWPARRPGSLITVSLAVGYEALPDDIVDAVLILAAARIDSGDLRAAQDNALSLLVNHRL
jgi:uncharacterized phiE125 gp8 family phage protein